MPDPDGPNAPVQPVRLLRDGSVVAAGEGAIAEAVRLLLAGAVVAIPTDTVYGLAAAPHIPGAMAEIFRLKGRATDQTLPVLIDDAATVGRLVAVSPAPGDDQSVDRLLRLATRFWPGALTVAFPARSGLAAAIVAADGTVGLRIPDHGVARHLIGQAGGALAVTSANRSGHPPATEAGTIASQFGGVDAGPRWILDAGPATGGLASTVIGCSDNDLVIHRVGAVDPDELRRAWATS